LCCVVLHRVDRRSDSKWQIRHIHIPTR
jgi:hypothetical protein